MREYPKTVHYPPTRAGAVQNTRCRRYRMLRADSVFMFKRDVVPRFLAGSTAATAVRRPPGAEYCAI
jgi:hypothetical protein